MVSPDSMRGIDDNLQDDRRVSKTARSGATYAYCEALLVRWPRIPAETKKEDLTPCTRVAANSRA